MNKQAYLDAMGITRWVEAKSVPPAVLILLDRGVDVDVQHPIITVVLDLLGMASASPLVTNKFDGRTVFWDMRKLKLPKVECRISSDPLSVMEREVKAKKALWESIYLGL